MPLPPRLLSLLVPVALLCLAGCPVWDLHASCADYDLCIASSGSTSTTTGEPGQPTGGIATVTSNGEATSTTTANSTAPGSTSTGDPAAPAVLSVMFTPDPLTQVGIIDVDVTAQADSVSMERAGFPALDLSKGQAGHFHGSIEVLSGMSNGTHEVTFVPRLEAIEGTAEIGHYTVMLPEAGEEKVWNVIPDDGPGQVEALAVLGDAIIGFGTVHEANTARCYLYRRQLDGTYAGDPRILFGDYHCIAVDVVTHDETIYVLAMVTGGDGPRWRLASMTWESAESVLRTGAKDEVAHALARSASGKVVACGTGPAPDPGMDTIDGRAWPLNGPTIELDYRPGNEWHLFDETVTDCKFRGEQLVLVGDAYGKHEEGDPNNQPPYRKRPFLVEVDGQGVPYWIVQGLGPGNTTQGGATALAIDGLGNALVGLHTCGDVCDPQSELRRYKPGGAVDWQVTLPAEVSMFDVAWSPAGYAIVAGALGKDLDTQFLLQGYLPGTYTPAWTFAKGKQTGLQVAFAALAAPGVVVGGGLGVGKFPAFAFVHP